MSPALVLSVVLLLATAAAAIYHLAVIEPRRWEQFFIETADLRQQRDTTIARRVCGR